jgi:hypothetical protein
VVTNPGCQAPSGSLPVSEVPDVAASLIGVAVTCHPV